MTIHPEFIMEGDESELAVAAAEALAKIPERKTGLRNRILRWGWSYEKPQKWIADPPEWIPSFRTGPGAPDVWGLDADSWSLNEYVAGQVIAPHIDSPSFGDVAILSLMADVTMRFTSPVGEIRDFILPRRSLAIMSGELRSKWQHSTLPLEADKRLSIVYRKRIT